VAAALFDASLYVYLVEWTPILQRAQSPNDIHALPFSIIYALCMVRIDK
jgi:hypothetical protein